MPEPSSTPRGIESRLSRAMLADRARLIRRLRAAEALTRQGQDAVPQREAFERDLARSIARRDARVRSVPSPAYPPELPVCARRDEIAHAIRDNQVVVVCGETGSGKTTQLPKICLGIGRGVAGMIGHTQPRRIAARTVAARVAEELGSPLGGLVGFKVRFGDRTGPETLVKLMTDGILLAETQADRDLEQYDTIIIDEAHERGLNIDFLLGYLRRLLPRRPELKLIITSATIDPQRFASHFAGPRGPAPIIEVSGRTYPVEIRHRPPADEDDDQERAIVAAVDELGREPFGVGPRDILVFLPGERDIREAADALRKRHPPDTEILPLYARLSAEEQMRAFRPHPGRRIVLATNVAETSLTVPGIRGVVDTGLARISRYSHRTKVQRLPIEPISRSSADQRAGRCGRVAPGVCIRLYSREDDLARPRFTDPEILRTNLASVILQMKFLRLGAVEDFPFVDPPEPRMVRDGYETLLELGAIDERGELTALGARVARLPIDPRLARMILAACDEDCLKEVLVIAAALSIQDPRERPMARQEAADQAHARFKNENSDFLALLAVWKWYHELPHSSGARRRACAEAFLSPTRMREWLDVYLQLHGLSREMGLRENAQHAEEDRIHRALLSGLLSNIGRRGEKFEYDGARASKFSIFPGSGLFKKGPGWLMAAEIVETTKRYARTAARIEPEWIERLAGTLVKKTHSDPHWSKEAGHAAAFERVTLFGLEIVARRRVDLGPIDPAKARELFIHHALIEGELRSPPPVVRDNLALVQEVRALEAKIRKPDLLVDQAILHDFYDRRLSPGVVSTHTLARWLKAPASDELLRLTRADLLKRPADEITPDKYPDSIPVFGTRLTLDYRFEPGEEDDGVTLSVPIEALLQIPPDRPDWLVPGLLSDKIHALFRCLPKPTRKLIDASPAFAQRIAEALLPRFGQGSLADALSAEIERQCGARIPRDAWATKGVPDQLRLSIALLDEQGKIITRSREIAPLLETYGPRARRGFDRLARGEFDRDNLTDWTFEALPEEVTLTRQGSSLIAYPAILDKGASVSLRMLESRDAAAARTREGLRRLFALRAREEIEYQLRMVPDWPATLLHAAPISSGKEFTRQLVDLAAERAFMDGLPPVRARDAFENRLAERWDQVGPVVRESARVVGEILAHRHALALRLGEPIPPAWAPVVQDIKEQVAALLPTNFLTMTPFERLAHAPRYMRAIRLRLDKLVGRGLERDLAMMAEVRPRWARYLERAARVRAGEVQESSALDEYRWLIEELRVSLFAQELGTAIPASTKRADDAWAKLIG